MLAVEGPMAKWQNVTHDGRKTRWQLQLADISPGGESGLAPSSQ